MSYIVNRAATGPLSLQAQGLFQQQPQSTTVYAGTATDSSLTAVLGTKWDLNDGRELTFILAGAVNLTSGKMLQNAALIANHQNLVTVSFTAYSNNGLTPASVVVTLGGTAVTANQYALGYAVVTAGTGLGQTLQIASHPAQATTTGNVTITLADAPNTALDATSTISLVPQAGSGIIISPASAPTNRQVGVSLYPITAANYGFVVSKGVVACLNTGGTTSGTELSTSQSVAGAVINGVIADGFVGTAIIAGTTAQYQPIFVDL